MNCPPFTAPPCALDRDLAAFHGLCREALDMATRENQALAGQNAYDPVRFNQLRKRLLPRLESGLIQLRMQRLNKRPAILSDEVVDLFQSIQSLVMKTLLLDRENQQALLRRGMVPAISLPAVGAQQPHFVAGLYRQHARTPAEAPA